MIVCDICQTPIYTDHYVAKKEPVHGSLGHKTKFYHLQCWIKLQEEMKL